MRFYSSGLIISYVLLTIFCLSSSCNKNKIKDYKEATYTLDDIHFNPYFFKYNAAVIDKKLQEISGLVTGRKNPNMVYFIEDRGNKNEVYLFSLYGKKFGTITIEGVENIDWEDIAIGPGPEEGEQYIYIGDIGDNEAIRDNIRVIRFKEPQLADFENDALTIEDFEIINLKYPDGARDAETLLLDPNTLDIIIITKRELVARVYQISAPYNTNQMNELSFIGLLPMKRVLGGDVDASGKQVMLKNKSTVYYWPINNGSVLNTLFKSTPISVFYIVEPQGEAIGFTADGEGYLTISETENHGGDKPTLYYYRKLD